MIKLDKKNQKENGRHTSQLSLGPTAHPISALNTLIKS